MKKILGVGIEQFSNLIEKGCYYVDKTTCIKTLMTSGTDVQLLLRPRRFGKTLLLDTLKTFLEINRDAPGDSTRQEKLFAGLKILKDQDFCARFMGQHPVLLMSLKDVKGENFEEALQGLAETLQPIVADFARYANGTNLTPDDRLYLERCSFRDHLLDPANRADLRIFLAKMATILYRHYRRTVVLLIDEYDVPLQKAYARGYYAQMLNFMQGFLSALKPGASLYVDGVRATERAILTSCLRISKSSIFTDVNSFDVNSVCMQESPLATAIGFTPQEVEQLLDSFSLQAKAEVVRTWYDGYRFGGKELYCPWDVIHYCKDILAEGVNREKFRPQNYWMETSSNDVIDQFLGSLSAKAAEDMQGLMDGGNVRFEINEQINYSSLADYDLDDFWTLLLFTGYLTVASIDGTTCHARIPNAEIREAFGKRIQKRFSVKNKRFLLDGEAIARAMLRADSSELQQVLTRVLRSYVSVRDTATRASAENYYHGFLNALLISAEQKGVIANLSSNSEAGDGYADLLFTSENERVGVVIELKHCTPNEKHSSAQVALTQIREKHYADGLRESGCEQLLGIGIAFSGKACAVEMGELDSIVH